MTEKNLNNLPVGQSGGMRVSTKERKTTKVQFLVK